MSNENIVYESFYGAGSRILKLNKNDILSLEIYTEKDTINTDLEVSFLEIRKIY